MAESKYPKGLFFLVFTEFWERFGYYLMIGIFFLYMTTDGKEGGMGWENATASDIFGTFIALAYLTPFMGGLLADLCNAGRHLNGNWLLFARRSRKMGIFYSAGCYGGGQWFLQAQHCYAAWQPV